MTRERLFKVGDRVKVSDADPLFRRFTHGVVTVVDESDATYRVTFDLVDMPDGFSIWYAAECLHHAVEA